MHEGVVEQVRAAGGEIYAITSEPQSLADQAHEHWELNFDNVGDPHQEVSRVCSERGWLTLYANQGNLAFIQTGAKWEVEHPKGYFQPGVLAVSDKKRILYRWRSVPSEENMHGTLARPTASHVWAQVEHGLSSDELADAVLDDDPVIDRAPGPRPIFYATLIANGWFLGPKSLVYSPGVDIGPSRFIRILSRWLLFLVIWIAALVLLPTAFVAVAFIGWLGWIIVKFRRLFNGPQSNRELLPENPA